MLKVFLLNTELLVKYFNLIFSWRVENLSIFTMTLCTSTSYYQVQLPVPIFHSHLWTWLLPMYLTIGAQSFDVSCRIPSGFSIPSLLPTSEIYSAFVAVWDSFCFYTTRYSIKQVTPYHLLVQWIIEQSVKSLYIQASPRALTLVKNILATTCCLHTTECTYSIIFAWLQC